jgi:hypothetical protein
MCGHVRGFNQCVKIRTRKEAESNIRGDDTNVKGKSSKKKKSCLKKHFDLHVCAEVLQVFQVEILNTWLSSSMFQSVQVYFKTNLLR